ncbi:hypothetical protein KA005_59330, partial [bacterium]|nr:hypothetical protein [bacterium]
FLSAFLGSAPWIMTLDADLRIIAYAILWMMSVSVVIIGAALLNTLEELGIGKLGSYGLFSLNTVLLIAYLYFVGAVIVTGISYYGFEIQLLGSLAFLVVSFAFTIVGLYYVKKKNKKFREGLQERLVPLLVELVPMVESEETIVRSLRELKKYPFIVTDDGVRSAIVKAVDSFDSKEKVIEEIEGFPELMESTEIREMVERAKRPKAEEES